MKNQFSVVIIGRINVGKSALFNRLTETTKALVSRVPGTTRDYNLAPISWQKKTFNLIDTGGVNIDNLKNSIESLLYQKKPAPSDEIEQAIIQQTKKALARADLILLVVDVQVGVLPEDRQLALVVKKLKIPTLLICNKVDNSKFRSQVAEFFQLGLGQPLAVSAINGSGSGDLLDEITKLIKGKSGRAAKTATLSPIKVAIVGKPNVGKSSLVNKILGEERVIVSTIPHTTREPQDTPLTYKKQNLTLIDTAGLRQKSKIGRGLEKLSARKTLETIQRSDVVILVTEVNVPLTVQDSRLGGLLKEARTGIIIVANKWDILTDKNQKVDSRIIPYYQRFFPYLSFAPLVFISAKTGRGVDKLLDLVLQIYQQRQLEIPENKLETILKKLVKKHRPAQAKGPSRPHLYQLTQTQTNPPEFTITVGQRQSIHFSYLRFIENQLRQEFDFIGVPLTIKVKTKK